MDNEKRSYESHNGVSVPKKNRRLKYDWDMQVIEEVKRLLQDDPSQSCHAALTDVLNRTLDDDQRIDFVSHLRRISNRIKIT